MGSLKITVENSEEGELELISNESFLMIHKEDVVKFESLVDGNLWRFRMEFINENNVNEYNISWKVDEQGIVQIKLNKWISSSWVENKNPLKLESVDKTITVFLKIKSTANVNQPYRTLTLSIWKKIVNQPM